MRVAVLIAALLIAGPTAAAAQDQPAETLNTTVAATLKAAARVHIWTTDGKRVVGSRASLGNEKLDVWVDGTWRSLPLLSLARIDVVERDSLKNGALIGAIVLGGLCSFTCRQGLDDKGQLAQAVAVNTALGALIGAGIDAVRHKRRTVYVRSAVSPTVGSRGMLSYSRRF